MPWLIILDLVDHGDQAGIKEWHGSGHQPHPHKNFPVPTPSPSALTPPHPHEIHPILIKSAVLYISAADNLTVYRRHKKISALLRAKCMQ